MKKTTEGDNGDEKHKEDPHVMTMGNMKFFFVQPAISHTCGVPSEGKYHPTFLEMVSCRGKKGSNFSSFPSVITWGSSLWYYSLIFSNTWSSSVIHSLLCSLLISSCYDFLMNTSILELFKAINHRTPRSSSKQHSGTL